MQRATFRFYAELNDFLPLERRAADIPLDFYVSAPVRDLIESLGVPHTEVDLILANGEPVDFSYAVRDGDRISVYPVFESFDLGSAARLHPRPLRRTRFALDVHLGRLAAYLRMLGFDTLYRNDYEDADLAEAASAAGRILLTRDRGLLKRSIVTRGYYVRETSPPLQLIEVLRRFDLASSVAPFTRCMVCNGGLEAVRNESVEKEIPARAFAAYDEFFRCAACRKIFWKGAHYRRMQRLIQAVLPRPPENPEDSDPPQSA